MKRFCLIFIGVPLFCTAQINPGPGITALGGAVTGVKSAWNLLNGQAGFKTETPYLALGYEQRFLSRELSVQTALFSYPFNQNAAGLAFQRYGFSAYSEQRATFAFQRDFGNTLSASLAFSYHNVNIKGYGSAQTFSAEAGLNYVLSKQIMLAAHVSNPSNNQFQTGTGITIPVRIAFGGSLQASDKIMVAVQVEKNLRQNSDGRLGIEYTLVEWLQLRGGISFNPFRQYAGFGLTYRKLAFDAAASSHPVLGYSPQVSIGHAF